MHRAGRTELEMEYAPGGNLADYVAKRRGLPEPEARRVFAQVVEGVGYLHGKNIAHRDLKLEVRLYIYIYIYTCVYVCVYKHTHTSIYLSIYLCICISG